MSDCKVEITGFSDKKIAYLLRQQAARHDPWHGVRKAILLVAIGAVTVAAMDYGDVWLCVGQCNTHEEGGK